MRCERAQELFSDRHEGVLSPILIRDLEEHLQACTGCRELFDAFGDVVAALRDSPVVEPPAGLAERAAAAALSVARRARVSLPWAARPVPRWLRAAAAILMLVTGATLLAAGPEAGQASAAGPIARSTASTASFLSDGTERLLEDARLMKIVVSAALEGRLDSLSDRFEEYRRSLQRRQADKDSKKSGAGPGSHLLNSEPGQHVTRDGTTAPWGSSTGATRSATS